MRTFFRYTMLIAFCFVTVALLSCCIGENSGNELEYLPVKLSKNEGWSIIDKNGKVVVDNEYSASSKISPVVDGVYWVKTEKSCQLFSIDNPKKPIVDADFTHVTPFNAGRALVAAPGKPIRIIDTKGQIVATLPSSIKSCYAFSDDGYAVFSDAEGYQGVIDKDGNVVVKPTRYFGHHYVCDGVVLAWKSGTSEYDVIDTKGEKLGTIDMEKYQLWGNFSEGKIILVNQENNNRMEVFGKDGKKLFVVRKSEGCEVLYEDMDGNEYMDGYAVFRNSEDKYGVVDAEGNEVIRAKYSYLSNLGNGEFAATRDANKWGVINAEDEEIIEFEYDGCIKFGDNYLLRDGNEGIIVKKGDKKPLVTFYDGESLYGYEWVYYGDEGSYADEEESSDAEIIDDAKVSTTTKAIDYYDEAGDVSEVEAVWSGVSEYLYSNKLTESDLRGASKSNLEIMRNMIYARHGYKFKRKDLLSFFSNFSWYYPVTGDAEYIYKQFSDIEKYNVEFIKKHE